MSTPTLSEEWRPAAGWELLYEVSSHGRVRRIGDGAIHKPVLNKDGYLQVKLSKEGKSTLRRVHTLVLTVFIGPPPFTDAVCRHLNGIRQDNRPSNLAWGTILENAADKVVHGTCARGLRNGGWITAKLTEESVRRIREARLFGARPKDLVEVYGMSRAMIYKVLTTAWQHVTIGV